MRRRRDGALASGALAAVDIGSSRLRCAVARFRGGGEGQHGEADLYSGVRVAGFAEMPAPASADLSRNLVSLLSSAVQAADLPSMPAVIALGGVRPSAVIRGANTALEGTVTAADIERAVLRTRIPVAQTRTRLSASVLDCAIDGEVSGNPLHEPGHELTVRVSATLADLAPVAATVEAVTRAGLLPAGLTVGAQAAAAACLHDSEARLGAALIDIGASHLGIAVIREGVPVHLDEVPMGAARLTADLASAFDLSMQDAERLKRGLDGPPDPDGPPRSAMLGVLRPRLEEMLGGVRDNLGAAGFYDQGPRPVVLTGGGALGYGVLESATRLLGHRARLGPPIRVAMQGGIGDMANATVLGALAQAIHAAHDPLERAALSAAEPATPLRATIDWLRQNW